MPQIYKQEKSNASGSALVYILIAIALLAALTASFMRPSSQQTTAQSSFNTMAKLKSQIEFVRSSIQECVLTYPLGDSGNLTASNRPYPINPSSTYLASPAGNDELAHIGCPGNPGNSNDHGKIFGGRSGKFMPPSPELFEPWVYYNGTDGVFFFAETNKTDAFLQTAMERLDGEFSECEADVVDATGGQIELTSTAAGTDPKCPNGSTCFRVWIIAQASNVYNGDTDNDEAGCP